MDIQKRSTQRVEIAVELSDSPLLEDTIIIDYPKLRDTTCIRNETGTSVTSCSTQSTTYDELQMEDELLEGDLLSLEANFSENQEITDDIERELLGETNNLDDNDPKPIPNGTVEENRHLLEVDKPRDIEMGNPEELEAERTLRKDVPKLDNTISHDIKSFHMTENVEPVEQNSGEIQKFKTQALPLCEKLFEDNFISTDVKDIFTARIVEPEELTKNFEEIHQSKTEVPLCEESSEHASNEDNVISNDVKDIITARIVEPEELTKNFEEIRQSKTEVPLCEESSEHASNEDNVISNGVKDIITEKVVEPEELTETLKEMQQSKTEVLTPCEKSGNLSNDDSIRSALQISEEANKISNLDKVTGVEITADSSKTGNISDLMMNGRQFGEELILHCNGLLSNTSEELGTAVSGRCIAPSKEIEKPSLEADVMSIKMPEAPSTQNPKILENGILENSLLSSDVPEPGINGGLEPNQNSVTETSEVDLMDVLEAEISESMADPASYLPELAIVEEMDTGLSELPETGNFNEETSTSQVIMKVLEREISESKSSSPSNASFLPEPAIVEQMDTRPFTPPETRNFGAETSTSQIKIKVSEIKKEVLDAETSESIADPASFLPELASVEGMGRSPSEPLETGNFHAETCTSQFEQMEVLETDTELITDPTSTTGPNFEQLSDKVFEPMDLLQEDCIANENICLGEPFKDSPNGNNSDAEDSCISPTVLIEEIIQEILDGLLTGFNEENIMCEYMGSEQAINKTDQEISAEKCDVPEAVPEECCGLEPTDMSNPALILDDEPSVKNNTIDLNTEPPNKTEFSQHPEIDVSEPILPEDIEKCGATVEETDRNFGKESASTEDFIQEVLEQILAAVVIDGSSTSLQLQKKYFNELEKTEPTLGRKFSKELVPGATEEKYETSSDRHEIISSSDIVQEIIKDILANIKMNDLEHSSSSEDEKSEDPHAHLENTSPFTGDHKLESSGDVVKDIMNQIVDNIFFSTEEMDAEEGASEMAGNGSEDDTDEESGSAIVESILGEILNKIVPSGDKTEDRSQEIQGGSPTLGISLLHGDLADSVVLIKNGFDKLIQSAGCIMEEFTLEKSLVAENEDSQQIVSYILKEILDSIFTSDDSSDDNPGAECFEGFSDEEDEASTRNYGLVILEEILTEIISSKTVGMPIVLKAATIPSEVYQKLKRAAPEETPERPVKYLRSKTILNEDLDVNLEIKEEVIDMPYDNEGVPYDELFGLDIKSEPAPSPEVAGRTRSRRTSSPIVSPKRGRPQKRPERPRKVLQVSGPPPPRLEKPKSPRGGWKAQLKTKPSLVLKELPERSRRPSSKVTESKKKVPSLPPVVKRSYKKRRPASPPPLPKRPSPQTKKRAVSPSPQPKRHAVSSSPQPKRRAVSPPSKRRRAPTPPKSALPPPRKTSVAKAAKSAPVEPPSARQGTRRSLPAQASSSVDKNVKVKKRGAVAAAPPVVEVPTSPVTPPSKRGRKSAPIVPIVPILPVIRNVAVKSTSLVRPSAPPVSRRSRKQDFSGLEPAPVVSTEWADLSHRLDKVSSQGLKRPHDVSTDSVAGNKRKSSAHGISISPCYVRLKKQAFIERMVSKHDDEGIFCEFCEPKRLFLSKAALVKHMKTEHSGTFGSSGARALEVVGDRCPGCNKKFHSHNRLIGHIQTCPAVTTPGNSPRDVSPAPRGAQASSARNVENDQRFSCDECSERFTLWSALKAHERMHWKNRVGDPLDLEREDTTSKGPYEAQLEQRGSGLKMMIRREKYVKCSLCGAPFDNPETLKMHERTHYNKAKVKKERESPELEVLEEYLAPKLNFVPPHNLVAAPQPPPTHCIPVTYGQTYEMRNDPEHAIWESYHNGPPPATPRRPPPPNLKQNTQKSSAKPRLRISTPYSDQAGWDDVRSAAGVQVNTWHNPQPSTSHYSSLATPEPRWGSSSATEERAEAQMRGVSIQRITATARKSTGGAPRPNASVAPGGKPTARKSTGGAKPASRFPTAARRKPYLSFHK